MPEITKYEPGTPSWVDLGTPDPVDASRFYSGLFGWSITEGPPEAGGYRMCMLDGKAVAGLGMQMNTDMPPWWTTYISVADADETAVAIKEDGGSLLVEPMDVLDVGRMAVAVDPAGAVFSIWQPRLHIGAGIVNDVNTFCWNELMTRNPQRSVEFYGAVFGWTANILRRCRCRQLHRIPPRWPRHRGDAADGGRRLAGRHAEQLERLFRRRELRRRGARWWRNSVASVMVPPTDVPPGKFAVVKDPQGAVFSVIALHPTAA